MNYNAEKNQIKALFQCSQTANRVNFSLSVKNVDDRRASGSLRCVWNTFVSGSLINPLRVSFTVRFSPTLWMWSWLHAPILILWPRHETAVSSVCFTVCWQRWWIIMLKSMKPESCRAKWMFRFGSVSAAFGRKSVKSWRDRTHMRSFSLLGNILVFIRSGSGDLWPLLWLSRYTKMSEKELLLLRLKCLISPQASS